MFLADRYMKERRDYIRMNVNCDIKCREIHSSKPFSGKGINLSSRGLLFETSHQPKPGTEVEILIPSAGGGIKPLTARGTIIRSQSMDDKSAYEVSMKINEMLN
jgi:hypothetical protein